MKSVTPSKIDGAVDAPPSKSMMQRAVIAAALAEGETRIANATFCDDALAALRVVETLGAKVERSQKGAVIRGVGMVRGESVEPAGSTLDCGESGTCMRMISAVAALYEREMTITGSGTLLTRPVSMVEVPLRALGARCETNDGKPPIIVKGPIHGGKITVDGSESSQFLSGLLMALPLCKKDSVVDVSHLKSKPYVSMTLALMRKFGVDIECDVELRCFRIRGGQEYRATQYAVDGDWSGAAFLLVAGAIAGSAKVRGLKPSSQADEAIVEALRLAGAEIRDDAKGVAVKNRELAGFDFDANDCPDLFPPLAVLACNCNGKSVIRGVGRLKCKESDRAAALVSELGKMGADIKVIGGRMEIAGKRLQGGEVESHGDHRIAMACAIAALTSEKGVEIEGDGCVSKSYPAFFEDLKKLGAIVK